MSFFIFVTYYGLFLDFFPSLFQPLSPETLRRSQVQCPCWARSTPGDEVVQGEGAQNRAKEPVWKPVQSGESEREGG